MASITSLDGSPSLVRRCRPFLGLSGQGSRCGSGHTGQRRFRLCAAAGCDGAGSVSLVLCPHRRCHGRAARSPAGRPAIRLCCPQAGLSRCQWTGRLDGQQQLRPGTGRTDLVERLRQSAPLAMVDAATLYSGGEHGYTDYPTWDWREDGQGRICLPMSGWSCKPIQHANPHLLRSAGSLFFATGCNLELVHATWYV